MREGTWCKGEREGGGYPSSGRVEEGEKRGRAGGEKPK